VVKDRVAGSGTIEGNTTYIYQGIVAPGHSPGCITNQGNVVLDATATLILEIGGTTACSQYDQFSIGQKLTINGATLQIVLVNGYTPSPGDSFPILKWAAESGHFGVIDTSMATLPGGAKWYFAGLYGSGGGSVSVLGPSATVPLPEWATAVLALALASIGFWVRNRQFRRQ